MTLGANAKIATFYSYKGGVGRSMVLANVAYLLADRYDIDVVLVDWDLEAPGLHRFFDIANEEVEKGLLDLVYDYKALLLDSDRLKKSTAGGGRLFDLSKYMIEGVHPGGKKNWGGGRISLLPAGNLKDNYAERLAAVDWEEFYEKWHGFGFIEFLKKELRKRGQIVLVDSRTGVTDAGGICTIQIPDIVVLLFALNAQNLEGIASIAESIHLRASKTRRGTGPPDLLLQPARVDLYAEQKELKYWLDRASDELGDVGKNSLDPDVLAEIAIPYVGLYSYGERIAVSDGRNLPLQKAMDGVTRRLLTLTGLSVSEPKATQQSTQHLVDAYELQAKAKEAIGRNEPGGWKIEPTRHADILRDRAPQLAAILESSEVSTEARRYERSDREAGTVQKQYKALVSRANIFVFLSAVLSAAVLTANSLLYFGDATRVVAMLTFGAAAVVCAGLAKMWLAQVEGNQLFERWMESRAMAETIRVGFFRLVTTIKPGTVGISLSGYSLYSSCETELCWVSQSGGRGGCPKTFRRTWWSSPNGLPPSRPVVSICSTSAGRGVSFVPIVRPPRAGQQPARPCIAAPVAGRPLQRRERSCTTRGCR